MTAQTAGAARFGAETALEPGLAAFTDLADQFSSINVASDVEAAIAFGDAVTGVSRGNPNLPASPANGGNWE